MGKDTIFSQRRELKRRGLAVYRSHIFILMFLTLVLALFGREYNYTTLGWGELTGVESSSKGAEDQEDVPGNILELYRGYQADDVYEDLASGKLGEAARKSAGILNELIENSKKSKTLSLTNGLLAQGVNAVLSGELAVRFAMAIRKITVSDRDASVLFILLSFLAYAGFFILLINVYSAAVRRVFLEARIYKKVHFLDIIPFISVRKWFHASWVMFVKYVFQFLWTFTIVGGIIKRYSYWAVPYIVAENPGISAGDAISLSREMMNGHKWELFKFELSLIGWILLGIVTFGVSEMVFGTPYRMACYSEFYVKVREMLLESNPEAEQVFNDRYLYEHADKILLYETYFDVVDEITVLHENRIELKGAKKTAAEWFGVWIGSSREKREYDNQEGRTFALEAYRRCMDGLSYPNWLNPLWPNKKLNRNSTFSFLRNYTIWTLFLLFMLFSIVGWSWEVAYHFMGTGQFANRGTLHGPWLPIYGGGGIIVLLLCSKLRKNPILEFFMSIALCGTLEYTSAWYLETHFHKRWWSYDGYFLNLHGRICAEGLLVFGVGCMIVVYLMAPLFDFLLSKIRQGILIGICIALAAVFGFDVAYSQRHPNMVEGAVEADPEPSFAESGQVSGPESVESAAG